MIIHQLNKQAKQNNYCFMNLVSLPFQIQLIKWHPTNVSNVEKKFLVLTLTKDLSALIAAARFFTNQELKSESLKQNEFNG